MKKFSLVRALCLWPIGLLSLVTLGHAATPVILSPIPKLFFVDKTTGAPLSFGCLFTYRVGTTTALATYSDYLGTSVNTNPIILTAAGFAGTAGSSGVYLQSGQSYTFLVKSAGGAGCVSGTTQETVDGIGGGNALATVATSCTGTCASAITAQIELFQVTLTGNTTADPITAVGITPPALIYYEIIQDSAGSHTWVWPANSRGGCTVSGVANNTTAQAFEWNGAVLEAIGPCVTANGPALSTGSIVSTSTITGTQLISTIATGTAPLVVASTTRVSNLNVSLLEDANWESPGQIGSVTPNNGSFSSLRVGGGTIQTATQGTDAHLQTAGTVVASSPIVCIDSLGGTTTTCTTTGPVFAPQRVVQGAGSVSIGANTQTIILTESVTFPSAPGTYRADVRYSQWITSGPNICGTLVVDTTNSRAFAFTQQNANGSGFNGYAASEISSQTYAAGATATFTLQAQCNAGSTATQKNGAAFTYSPDPSSFLSVTPVLSN